MMRTMNRLHGGVLRLTRGRLGWHLYGMPVVELTTIGRRSGEPRTSLLTSPIQVNGEYVIVASRGGDDVHPAWYLNLRSNPEVRVRTGPGAERSMTARVADPSEAEDLWRRIGEYKPHYLRYQERTSRPIPLVLLSDSSA
jgi:deazaflavin-dependent oxidoreductase (nitroreductase family)